MMIFQAGKHDAVHIFLLENSVFLRHSYPFLYKRGAKTRLGSCVILCSILGSISELLFEKRHRPKVEMEQDVNIILWS